MVCVELVAAGFALDEADQVGVYTGHRSVAKSYRQRHLSLNDTRYDIMYGRTLNVQIMLNIR